MFTVGNKEAIVNSNSYFPITESDGTAFAAANAAITIKGFGTFAKTQITAGSGKRYQAGEKAALRVTIPTAANIGLVAADDLNVATVFTMRVGSTRDASEWANDFIKRSKNTVIEIVLNYGETADQVATKLIDAFDSYKTKFNFSELPFTYTKVTDTTNVGIEFEAKYDDLYFFEMVEFLRRGEIFGYKPTTLPIKKFGVTGATALAGATTIPMTSTTGVRVGDTLYLYDVSANTFLEEYPVVLTIPDGTSVTVATGFTPALQATDIIYVKHVGRMASVSGKELEENVKMSTEYNTGSYVIGAGEMPDVNAGYTAITWTAVLSDTTGIGGTGGWAPHANLSTVAAGAATGTRTANFTLYFKEGSDCFADNGRVELLVDWLIDCNGVAATDFFVATNATAADGNAFIA